MGRSMTKDCNHLGKFHLEGIPPMPRGVPQIHVTYDIDANGILNVTAKETSTGKENKIQIKNESGRLSQADIDRMVNEAEAHKAEDEANKKKIDARNGLENFVYGVRNTITDPKLEGKLPAEDKTALEGIVDDAIKWLDSNSNAEVSEYESKKKELEGKINPILAKLQGAAGGMPGGMPGGAPSPAEDDGPSIEEVD